MTPDLPPDSLRSAIEHNAAGFILALGRAGRAEERDDVHVQWTIGGSPIDYHNCVIRADLSPEFADGVIRESRSISSKRQRPWHTLTTQALV